MKMMISWTPNINKGFRQMRERETKKCLLYKRIEFIVILIVSLVPLVPDFIVLGGEWGVMVMVDHQK